MNKKERNYRLPFRKIVMYFIRNRFFFFFYSLKFVPSKITYENFCAKRKRIISKLLKSITFMFMTHSIAPLAKAQNLIRLHYNYNGGMLLYIYCTYEYMMCYDVHIFLFTLSLSLKTTFPFRYSNNP